METITNLVSKLLTLFFTLLFVGSQLIHCNVTYDKKSLLINGQRRILISGSIHYPRSTPEVCMSPIFFTFFFFFVFQLSTSVLFCLLHIMWFQMWEDLIRKAKGGGLDAIDTYVFWNVHEPSPGIVPLWNLDLHCIESGFKFSSTISQCVVFNCSTILKGGTIWYGSLRQCRGWGSMCIFGLDLMCVLSGTLGRYTFNFPLWISLVCWCECECLLWFQITFFNDAEGFLFGWSMFLASVSERIMALSRLDINLKFLVLSLSSEFPCLINKSWMV